MGTDVVSYCHADEIRGEGAGKFSVRCCVTFLVCHENGKMLPFSLPSAKGASRTV